jgi:MFS family permease
LIAGSALGFITRIRKPGAVILWSVAIYGLATLVFGIARSFVVPLLMLAATGASGTVSMILRQTIRQVVTPDELRGRMTSVNMIFFMGGPQLGELEAGVVDALFGAPALRRFDEEDLKQANAALVAAGK